MTEVNDAFPFANEEERETWLYKETWTVKHVVAMSVGCHPEKGMHEAIQEGLGYDRFKRIMRALYDGELPLLPRKHPDYDACVDPLVAMIWLLDLEANDRMSESLFPFDAFDVSLAIFKRLTGGL